jgi:hypothetical protein
MEANCSHKNGGQPTTRTACSVKYDCHSSCVHMKVEPPLSDDLSLHCSCKKGLGMGEIGGGEYPKKVPAEVVRCPQYVGKDWEW